MFISIDVISNNNCSIARLGVGLNVLYVCTFRKKLVIFWYLAKAYDSIFEESNNSNSFDKKCVRYTWVQKCMLEIYYYFERI